ncbi:alpha/beta-hydrolase family protein [Halomonas sp. 707D7]|uniref:alpha/beta hydrolase n=3 Tax=unclassified Halomonas TaxID=2609666 RepID=UPI00209D4396|nr:alpha/beta-hydrolase family protein [Halomonas sp. 707D7]MCP1314061.1 alpha/beta-hydrolase family protein [Halomonas sp. 707D7]
MSQSFNARHPSWRIRRFLEHFSSTGLIMATLLFALSLTPSLVPRPLLAQGIVSGLCISAGYAIGVLLHEAWRYLRLPEPRARLRRLVSRVAWLVCALVAALFLWQASNWQNGIRLLMGMEPDSATRGVSIAAIALLIFFAFYLLGLAFRRTYRLMSRRVFFFLPRRLAYLLGSLAALALFWLLIEGVLFSYALRFADRFYQQLDDVMQDDLAAPLDSLRPGSDASLISWEALGSRGRRFTTEGPDGDEIGDFLNAPALDPIRVYVGLNARETVEERAELALAELVRIGGFERSMLLLATPTGRGWIDPGAQDTIEYLMRGDIATVTAQYSYLPSHLSLIAEGDYGVESARALFIAIYRYWSELPENQRPALYLFGLSLGALNSDRSFDFYDIIEDPFNGALWAGPPFRSDTWRSVTADRDAGSPEWLPVFRGGRGVRFMNQTHGYDGYAEPWGDFRIAYLQYASDPIVFFDPAAFWREPDWMRAPRGPDVSPALRWYPVVTMFQLLVDLATGGAPPGYGHEVAAEHYLKAWNALVEPEGWSESDLERLAAHVMEARQQSE